MGVKNGKRKTGKRRFVQTKRSRFSSKSIQSLSLSRLRARFPAPATTTRSTPRTRARKRETERFAMRKKRYPAAFLERLWFHAHSFRRDLKRPRQERRRMVEAGEKRTLSHDDAPKTRSSRLSSTTPAWRGCRKTNRTATCFDVVVSFCGATEAVVIFKEEGGGRKNFMCDTLNVSL